MLPLTEASPPGDRGVRPIADVARDLGLDSEQVLPYGEGLAKLPVDLLSTLERSSPRRGKLVLVTSMTPTTHGEGKTVTSIGLAMALRKLGYRSTVALRQPSLGPTLGLKGGGAGGGRATVEPAALLNLGFPGDTAAVTSAHNLLSALIDNHLYHRVAPIPDPGRIEWPRTLDMDDRALREVRVGVGEGKGRGPARADSFIITAASEVMAILGLAQDHVDLKKRLGRIFVGWSGDSHPIYAEDLGVAGAMAALLRDALRPNLVQTSEGTPAFVHTGPFANLGHGTASLLSIRMARALSEICLVETGFASDLGLEKFMDLVSPVAKLSIDGVVVVATLPALRYHGGVDLAKDREPNPSAVSKGLVNLEKHLDNVRRLGLAPVVALNRFPGDSPEEVRLVGDFCDRQGVACADSTAYAEGSAGALQLAEVVLDLTRKGGAEGHALYDPGTTTAEEKLDRVAREVYGADGVELAPEAQKDLEEIRSLGHGQLPLCIAKTPLSLSDDPHLRGRPKGFVIRVHRVLPRTGAGYLVATTGEIVLMPGLPKAPAALDIDLSPSGEITGVR